MIDEIELYYKQRKTVANILGGDKFWNSLTTSSTPKQGASVQGTVAAPAEEKSKVTASLAEKAEEKYQTSRREFDPKKIFAGEGNRDERQKLIQRFSEHFANTMADMIPSEKIPKTDQDVQSLGNRVIERSLGPVNLTGIGTKPVAFYAFVGQSLMESLFRNTDVLNSLIKLTDPQKWSKG